MNGNGVCIMNICNTAGRLYEILTEMKKLHNPLGKKLTIKESLVTVFNLNDKENSEVYYKMAEIMELIRNVKDEIKLLELEEESEFIGPINKIAEVFSGVSLDSSLELLFKENFGYNLQSLKFCAITLKRERRDIEIDQEELNTVYKQFEALRKQVIETELPKQLRVLILKNIDEIMKSINDFKVKGLEGLKRTVESSVGSLILNRETVSGSRDGASIVEKILKNLSNLNQLLSASKTTKELLEPIIQYLSHK